MKTKNAPPPVPQKHEAPKFVSAQPKIVSMDAITFVGMEKRFTFDAMSGISVFWMNFMKVSDQIQNKVDPEAAWGVSYDMDYSVQPGEFTYFVGMEISNTENIPDGMIVYVAPASKYAKFTHYGSLDKLSETYTYIYNVWFPQSGYDMGMVDGLELYGKNFDPQSSKSEMYIFVPIK
jgi:Uncharacterized protein conserved in bacteria